MTTLPTLTDAQVYRTYYFVPGYERDLAHMHAFDLETLFTAAAQELDASAAPVDLKVIRPPGSVRLTEVPFQADRDPQLGVEARTLHDSYMLTTAVQHLGPVADGDGAPLEPHVPKNLVGLPLDKYLGKATVYAVEVPVGTTPAAMRAAAARYADRHGFSPNRIPANTASAAVLIDLNTPAPGEPDAFDPRCVVVYPAGAAVDLFRGVALPELLLYHLKARVQYDACGHMLGTLRNEDDRLRELVEETRDPSRLDADRLLVANDRLTTLLTELVIAVSATENLVHTAKIARKNFARAAAECGFDPTELVALTRALVDEWVTILNDLAGAALGYRRRTRDVARVHFESLQATMEMHQTRETRSVAMVMTLLTCAQVAGVAYATVGDDTWKQFFGEDYPTAAAVGVRLCVTIVCSGLLGILLWARWLRRPAQKRATKYLKPKVV